MDACTLPELHISFAYTLGTSPAWWSWNSAKDFPLQDQHLALCPLISSACCLPLQSHHCSSAIVVRTPPGQRNLSSSPGTCITFISKYDINAHNIHLSATIFNTKCEEGSGQQTAHFLTHSWSYTTKTVTLLSCSFCYYIHMWFLFQHFHWLSAACGSTA